VTNPSDVAAVHHRISPAGDGMTRFAPAVIGLLLAASVLAIEVLIGRWDWPSPLVIGAQLAVIHITWAYIVRHFGRTRPWVVSLAIAALGLWLLSLHGDVAAMKVALRPFGEDMAAMTAVCLGGFGVGALGLMMIGSSLSGPDPAPDVSGDLERGVAEERGSDARVEGRGFGLAVLLCVLAASVALGQRLALPFPGSAQHSIW
jgi:hypothetical protein